MNAVHIYGASVCALNSEVATDRDEDVNCRVHKTANMSVVADAMPH